VSPQLRRFLPLMLVAAILLFVLPSVFKKKSSSNACHPAQTAKCSDAYLVNVNLSGAKLTSAVFARADLAGADLHNADLTGANLAGADVSGADLAGATLTNTSLRGTNLTGADLTGAIHANLSGAIVCHTLLPSGHFPVHDC
jgi:uncharacterized protein YjbI with pentapeptide repeats